MDASTINTVSKTAKVTKQKAKQTSAGQTGTAAIDNAKSSVTARPNRLQRPPCTTPSRAMTTPSWDVVRLVTPRGSSLSCAYRLRFATVWYDQI